MMVSILLFLPMLVICYLNFDVHIYDDLGATQSFQISTLSFLRLMMQRLHSPLKNQRFWKPISDSGAFSGIKNDILSTKKNDNTFPHFSSKVLLTQY